jgi:hypothetical protein
MHKYQAQLRRCGRKVIRPRLPPNLVIGSVVDNAPETFFGDLAEVIRSNLSSHGKSR